MSKISFTPNASGTGTFTIASPDSNTNRTLTLPDADGELLTDGSSLDAGKLTGTLPAIDGSALTGISAGIGEGQTPQPVSRSIDTSYQNTTGRPILVSVGSGSRDSDLLEVSSNNSTWVTAAYGDGGSRSTRTTVVPNNWYYRYGPTASTSAFWMEIR